MRNAEVDTAKVARNAAVDTARGALGRLSVELSAAKHAPDSGPDKLAAIVEELGSIVGDLLPHVVSVTD